MGFCRRCGEIVVGPRCKCGGTAVGVYARSSCSVFCPSFRVQLLLYRGCSSTNVIRTRTGGPRLMSRGTNHQPGLRRQTMSLLWSHTLLVRKLHLQLNAFHVRSPLSAAVSLQSVLGSQHISRRAQLSLLVRLLPSSSP
jgi:hypothetical protein